MNARQLAKLGVPKDCVPQALQVLSVQHAEETGRVVNAMDPEYFMLFRPSMRLCRALQKAGCEQTISKVSWIVGGVR